MTKFPASAAHLEMHQFVRIIQQGSLKGEAPAFRAANTLSFPFSDISASHTHQDREEIEFTCLGLQGVSSPLPHYFITDALDDVNESLRGFLGIFNQQIYRAYFHAWESKHPHLFHRTAFHAHEMIASLGTDEINACEPIPHLAVLFVYAQRSIHELRDLIAALYPEISSQIIVQDPEWIENHTPSRLGSASVADTLTLGKRIPTHAHRLKLLLGPLSLIQITSAQVHHWITRYLNRRLKFDIEWIITPNQSSSCLGHQMSLGWNSTLGIRKIAMNKVQHANTSG